MKYIIGLVLVLSLMSCDVNSSKFGTDEAKTFVNNITYVKDTRTNLCFALIASRRTGSFSQSGMGISQVPCDAVDLDN